MNHTILKPEPNMTGLHCILAEVFKGGISGDAFGDYVDFRGSLDAPGMIAYGGHYGQQWRTAQITSIEGAKLRGGAF
jgi:hypothetical protein